MSGSQDKPTPLQPKPETERDYEVGYGKPPVATRFKPGTSGNSKGRPKGARNRPPPPALHEERLKAIILEEAYRPITVNDQTGRVTIPMAQAVMRSLAVNAAKGLQRSQRLFTELVATTEQENRRLHEDWLATAMDYKFHWEQELDRRKRSNLTHLPDPLPHPDHIVVDLRAGTVRLRGPATKEEKAQWDMWHERRAGWEQELQELERMLDDPSCEHRERVLEEIANAKRVLDIIRRVLDW